jgi:AcrR family transcriptional regulator
VSPRGRRPAGEDTRGAIIEAARAEFAESGYDATSLRGIARRAGVDPALVHHYFEGKAGVFAEVMAVPFRIEELVKAILRGPEDEVGRNVVRTFLTVWDAPAGRTRFQLFVRGATTQRHIARMLREFLVREVFTKVARAAVPGGAELDPATTRRRASLAATQMIGLGMFRYVIELEPVASMPAEELVELIGPTIQRYLTEG